MVESGNEMFNSQWTLKQDKSYTEARKRCTFKACKCDIKIFSSSLILIQGVQFPNGRR